MADLKASGLSEAVKSIVRALDARRERREKISLALVQKLFDTLRDSHRTFLGIIHSLREDVELVGRSSGGSIEEKSKSVSKLTASLTAARTLRENGRPDRQELYHSARAIIDSTDISFSTMMVILNTEELLQLKDFLIQIAAYFESDDKYNHELYKILSSTRHWARKWEGNRAVDPADAKILLREMQVAIKILDLNWARCVEAFTRLNSSLNFDLSLRP